MQNRWAIGQFFGPLALKIMNDNNPDVWLTPVYTQWGHIGLLMIIYAFVPETPCKYSQAKRRVLSLI